MGFFGGQMDFTDPNTLALLGATGALGEAAMPSRLPIPTGAMLAKAAGGLAAGSHAYKNQLEQAQTKLANAQAAMSTASIDAVKRQLQMMGQMPGSETPASPAGPTPNARQYRRSRALRQRGPYRARPRNRYGNGIMRKEKPMRRNWQDMLQTAGDQR